MRIKPVIKNVTIRALVEREKALETEMFAVGRQVIEAQKKCVHQYIPLDPYDPTDKWFSSSGFCENCGDRGGWWCPKSKDGQCDYENPNGEDYLPNCICCGMPDERK